MTRRAERNISRRLGESAISGNGWRIISRGKGNRTQTRAGGDSTGANQRVANYFANPLNQYTNRDVPGAVDVIGVSIATNAVTVNGQTAYRKGEYFRQQLNVNNTSAAVWTNITVSATGQSSQSGNQFVPKTQEQFAYDLDGNLTRDGRWNYGWDAENRLVALTNNNATVGPQQVLRFEYDAKGRRIHKQVWGNNVGSGSPTSDLKFLYDGWNLLVILNSPSSLLESFLWGLDLSGSPQGAGGVGGLLEVVYYGSTTTNSFVAFDGNGNLAALVNAADGTSVAQYEYGPFGEVIRKTGPACGTNPLRFSTKYQDDETDLLYYGYRHYCASTGRWLSRDVIGEKGGKNLYGFVNNESVAHWDKLGQFPNPFERQKPPPNNIDPPPSGPFSQCKIALQCGKAVSGQEHCGLVVDTGSGVYAIDGSGGTVNSRWVTPASTSDATSSWTDNSTSVCECLFGSIKPWNEQNYSRDQTQNNSNWNLKCLNKKCSVVLDWGVQQKPIGYDGKYCAKWTWISHGPPIGSCARCDKIVDCPEDK